MFVKRVPGQDAYAAAMLFKQQPSVPVLPLLARHNSLKLALGEPDELD